MLWPFTWSASSSSANPTSAASPPASPTALKPASKTGGGATDKDADAGVEAQTALASWAALLKPFEGGGALPENARTNPGVKMAAPTPMTLLGLWQYLPFVAKQSTSLTKAFVQHHLYGPPKPSWGVELTLFTTFLREVSSYSHLSSLTRLRSVLELGSLLPTPKDGIVTPISFRVRRRNLRGILAPLDEKEDGTREIQGEWVTNKRLWRKMTREWMTADGKGKQQGGASGTGGSMGNGSASGKAREKDCTGKDGLVCLYLHGGAYYMFSAETHRYLTISVSRYCEARVFAINYRLAPETRFPGQLHDAVSAYMRLTVDLKIPPENIIFAGDSAGGGLCLATLMYLRDEGYSLPSGAILMSPWCDLTMSCASWETNRPYDYLPNPNSEDDHLHPVKCLLGDSIEEYLTHPYVSPLFGDFKGLPPLLVQAGDAEVLRDEITLLAHKAALAGVKVEHEIFEDCVHVFQAFLFLEASRKAFQSQRTYVKHTLPRLRRKLAHAASSSSRTTSVAPSPTTTGASSDLSTDRSEFDFAEVDREVVQDAHQVDQNGKAEEESLPPTPQGRRADLPPGEDDLFDEEVEEEEGEEANSSDERMSDSTASPANSSPAVTPSTPTKGTFAVADEESLNLEEQLAGAAPSPGYASAPLMELEDPAAPPLPLSPPGSSSSAAGNDKVQHQQQRRPILRGYASARDLSMSNLHAGKSSSPDTAASSPAPLLTRKRRSFTTTTASASSSHPSRPRSSTTSTSTSSSTPTSPRLSLTSRPLAPLDKLDSTRSPRLLNAHARSKSNVEVEELLRSYNDEKGAVRAKTRVWGPAAQAKDEGEGEEE